MLTDLPGFGVAKIPDLSLLMQQAHQGLSGQGGSESGWQNLLRDFLVERETHLLEKRGYRLDEARAVTAHEPYQHWLYPHLALKRIEALSRTRASNEFQALAALFKRVKNITKGFARVSGVDIDDVEGSRSASRRSWRWLDEIARRWPAIESASSDARYRRGHARDASNFRSAVELFFKDVLVMADEPALRKPD